MLWIPVEINWDQFRWGWYATKQFRSSNYPWMPIANCRGMTAKARKEKEAGHHPVMVDCSLHLPMPCTYICPRPPKLAFQRHLAPKQLPYQGHKGWDISLLWLAAAVPTCQWYICPRPETTKVGFPTYYHGCPMSLCTNQIPSYCSGWFFNWHPPQKYGKPRLGKVRCI